MMTDDNPSCSGLYFHPQEADLDPAGGYDLCIACRIDELRDARIGCLRHHRFDTGRHRCGSVRGILRAEPARTVVAQRASAALDFDLYRGCGGALRRRRSPLASADGSMGYLAESLSAIAVRIAAGDRVFGDRYRGHADGAFHR